MEQKSIYFLHGLESSGSGTKGRFLGEEFPHIKRPDFTGRLDDRLAQLERLTKNDQKLLFVGSSYGGLMATTFAIKHPQRVVKLILLAPALNFEGYLPPEEKLAMEVHLIIGAADDVTPVDPVVKLAQETFSNISVSIVEDDHMLHKSYQHLAWDALLSS